ncbi:hypothetical protein [Legionella nagasakiensis]|uniref:hypothetical protein n=1 Tax=Legionella nagasakiensis TaxID=535290 RepID=UPI00105582BC|nr:hypothetical protein [Legionella nagasakiensis]
MTTPSHYFRRNLRKLLGKNQYYLYHWTNIDSAMSILKDGYIFSKAMLFGLHYHDNPQILKKLKRNDVIAEAKNGFINYVFLGNTNWLDQGSSFYGDVCFVIRPEAILLTREFFVFPFNTGRYFLSHSDEDKTCDTRTLMDALNQEHPCFEILVRRRIKINNKNISKLICPEEYRGIIQKHLHNDKSDIVVENSYRVDDMDKQEYIELIDPLDTAKNKLILNGDQYMRQSNHIYVKTSFSNCLLKLRINESNELIDTITNKQVGRIIDKHDTPTPLRPFHGN